MEHDIETLTAHAMQLQQALNTAVQSELVARRELDEYRKAEIAELRKALAKHQGSAEEGLLKDAGIKPEGEVDSG